MARSVWTGAITFGLVSVGVKAVSAARDHDVHFHQIDKNTGSRIGNQKVSKDTGDPVEKDDIELGYEVSKGKYVTFDPDEIDELRPQSTRTVAVSDFVDLHEIDPVFYERTYWLVPSDEATEHAYRLLADAMEETQRVGIGSVVMRNKQYLAAIRPVDGVLAMSTMRFADEVVDVADVEGMPSKRKKSSAKERELATQIIEALSADWQPEQYSDTFTEELRSMIDAKAQGEELVVEEEADEEPAKVIDLMAALERSVEEARGRGSKRSSGSSSKRPSSKASSKRSSSSKAPSKKSGSSSRKGPAKKAPTKASSSKSGGRKRSPSKAPAKKSA